MKLLEHSSKLCVRCKETNEEPTCKNKFHSKVLIFISILASSIAERELKDINYPTIITININLPREMKLGHPSKVGVRYNFRNSEANLEKASGRSEGSCMESPINIFQSAFDCTVYPYLFPPPGLARTRG